MNTILQTYKHLTFDVSDNEETRSRTLACLRIMMTSGSLLRWKALNLLSTTRFIQTAEFTALVDYTASQFFPRSHHLDNHGYCPFPLESEEYFRHCDKDGRLIHLSVVSRTELDSFSQKMAHGFF